MSTQKKDEVIVEISTRARKGVRIVSMKLLREARSRVDSTIHRMKKRG